MAYNVCFLSSYFPPVSIGGVERYLLNISEGLKKYDFSSVILTRYYPPLTKKDKCSHYSLYRIGLNPFPFTTKRYISGFIEITGDLFTFSFLGFYEALKIAKKFDIVHSQLGRMYDVHLGAKLATKLKKPFIVTVHGRFGQEPGDIHPEERLFQDLSKADYLIVNREKTYNFLIDHDLRNIAIMQNAVPVHEYERPEDLKYKRQGNKVRVLFIGRLVHRRGPRIALQGFAYATKKFPDIELWVVGEGSLKSSLMFYVKELGLQKQVVFLGKQLDVKQLLWSCDIFLATSSVANSPSLSLREAMAAGLAVVATDVEKTKSIVIPYKTGILVPPRDPSKLGKAIVTLARDNGLRKQLSKAATEYAERNFDMYSYTKKLVAVYRGLMKRTFDNER